jgi:RHH-type proline utilization regulon transcriptional repressor/proline dehydrogenase/delta 1-pyrroline-5-carboxylate dehydrogenase
LGAFINFDMESYAHKNATLELFECFSPSRSFAIGRTPASSFRLTCATRKRICRDLIAWGRERGTRFTVRLVKGAYWDYEKIKSTQNGWVIPVWLQKPESDANFERLTRILLENESIVTSAFGSHNVRSIAHAQALAEELGIDRSRFEFQLLYGMAGPIKRALVEMGYRVREYSPVGELLPGMSYLVRRLLENTSNEGFLRAKFSEHVSAAQLLRDPRDLVNGENPPSSVIPSAVEGSRRETFKIPSTGSLDFARDDGTGRNGATPDMSPGDTYKNASLTNFVHPESQEKMRAALRDVRARFGQKYPLVIDGKEVWTDKLLPSLNPSAPDQIVGLVAEAGIPEAESAVKAARRAFDSWGRTPFEERCRLLERVAAILDRRRFELSAVEVLKSAKPGPKPTATSVKRWIFASSTPIKCGCVEIRV